MTGSLWIGVDGGATSVRAVAFRDAPSGRLIGAGRRAAQDWNSAADFEPLPVSEQLASSVGLTLEDLGPGEQTEALARIHTIANLVAELTFGVTLTEARLGLCLPGRPSEDRRSIVASANGPRLPGALDELARQFEGRHLTLAAPVDRIHSDGEAAGWGEELGEEGSLHGVDSALVIGVGTGVAEAAKVAGRHLDPAQLAALGPAPWRAESEVPGAVVEEVAGLRGMNARLVKERGPGLRLFEAVRRGEPAARAVLSQGARALAAHVTARCEALGGVERVVLGQRAVQLWTDPELAAVFRPAFEAGVPEPSRVVASRLRDAPALGACAAALGRVTPLRAGSD